MWWDFKLWATTVGCPHGLVQVSELSNQRSYAPNTGRSPPLLGSFFTGGATIFVFSFLLSHVAS